MTLIGRGLGRNMLKREWAKRSIRKGTEKHFAIRRKKPGRMRQDTQTVYTEQPFRDREMSRW